VITSLKFLKTYIDRLLVNKWSSRRPQWSGSVSIVFLLLPSDLCLQAMAMSGRQNLCCASSRIPLVLCVQTAVGRRSFAVNGPTTWNSLSPALRAPELSQRLHMCTEDKPVLDRQV